MEDIKNNKYKRDYIKWLSLAIALFSLYYAWNGNQIAKESNLIAKEAKTSSKNLFLVEKRPYLNVYIERLENGSYIDTESLDSNAIFKIQFKNEGDIPAREIQTTIYFFDEKTEQYNRMSIKVPPEQKILPEKLHEMIITMGYEPGSPGNLAIKNGELRFQVVVEYRSDINEEVPYTTIKQFLVTNNSVTLLGNVGEFY